MPSVEELLHRRSDLSTFLVHLTRDGEDGLARDRLLNILEDRTIEARTAFGPAAQFQPYLEGDALTDQRCVCWTETPLEHTWMLVQDIERRSVKLQPYGIVITKTRGRLAGCNPVWYSDITPGSGEWLANSYNELINRAVSGCTVNGRVVAEALRQEPIFRLTPFFEQMGPTNNGGRKEWWWEREWRHRGNFHFQFTRRVVAILVPEEDHDQFRSDLGENNDWIAGRRRRALLDPRWGLERMLVELADIYEDDIGPFPGS